MRSSPAPSLTASTRHSRASSAAVGAGITVLLLFVASFGVVLAAATTAGLSQRQTLSLFIVLHGLSALMSLGLTLGYRQPMMATYSFAGFLLAMDAVSQHGYAATVGSVLVTGVLLALVGLLGWSARIAVFVPPPLVQALLAGVLLPFAVGVFTALDREPILIGSIVIAYLIAVRMLGSRIPAIVPALIVGVLVAAAQGNLHGFPDGWVLVAPSPTRPTLSWRAIVSVAPVLTVLLAVNANLTTTIFLRAEGFQPPRRAVDVVSGVFTVAGSLFGVVPMCLGGSLNTLTGGPTAGAPAQRRWAVYVAATGLLVATLLAGLAAQLPLMLPTSLLLAVAGLAVLPILGQMLTAMASDAIRLGPLFAFCVAISNLSLGGFGSLFWALVIGMTVTLVLETDVWQAWRASAEHSRRG